MTLTELKARGYELISFIDQTRAELQKVNEQIAIEMSKLIEEPVKEDTEPKEEIKEDK